MTNLAKSTMFLEDVEIEPVVPVRVAHTGVRAGRLDVRAVPKSADRKKNKRLRALSWEDQQIVMALNTITSELECLHNRYDQTTDPLLVDSIIYELKAANMKYMYYLHLCKEKGIIGGSGSI